MPAPPRLINSLVVSAAQAGYQMKLSVMRVLSILEALYGTSYPSAIKRSVHPTAARLSRSFILWSSQNVNKKLK